MTEVESEYFRKTSDQDLDLAIAEAYQMLHHAVMKGREIDPAIVNTLTNIRLARGNGAVSQKLESAFWLAAGELARSIEPATLESIALASAMTTKAMRTFPFLGKKKIWLETEVVAAHFRKLSVAIFIILLFVQAYWILGISLMESVEALEEQFFSEGSTAPERLTSITELRSTMNLFESVSMRRLLVDIPTTNDAVLRETYERNLAEFTMRHILAFISLILLPMLYGVFGACIYVLKEVTDDIANNTYTHEKRIIYRLRILLGLFAGLMTVWLLNIDNFFEVLESDYSTGSEEIESTWNSITPFFLAFLAGYSIEIFFTSLDKLVKPVR